MAFDFSHFQVSADKVITHIVQELSALRTGKASVQLLDTVKVEAYGNLMGVNEVASISVPDPHLLVITPWDKGLLGALEKAIQVSALHMNPVVDGNLIRIAIPPLTQERRLEMVKLLHQKVESGKVMIRGVRTDTKKEIEKQKTDGGVSEDMVEIELAELEKKVKMYSDKLEQLAKAKEADLLKI